MQENSVISYSTPSLIGACMADRSHRDAVHDPLSPWPFDFAVGINRWGFRLPVYVALMTDRYPPFRLDQGSIDIEGPAQPPEPSEASQ